MKKQLKNAFLVGAALTVAAGGMTSCNNDDVDDLKTRMSVVEVALGDLKAQISKAITVGATVTDVKESNGTYTLTLSDGQTITIKPGGGGGEAVAITVTDSEAIITVGDQTYTLPLGSAVNSLIYSPEFEDGKVLLGKDGATVRFLPRPALADINGAEFAIAEAHELKSRGGDGEEFKATGATLDADGLISVNIIGLGCEAGKSYAVSVQMKYHGAVIGSNYFNIVVGDDFYFENEAIDPNVKVTAHGATFDAATNTYSFTLEGDVLLGDYNFSSAFTGVPEGAEFRVAPASQQPEGDAKNKADMLRRSMSANGAWKFAERPGTSFNGNESQKGFLITVVKAEQVIAKSYVMINDPFANADFQAPLKGLCSNHMEYGVPTEDGSEGEGLHFAVGENMLDIAAIIVGDKFALRHGNTPAFVKAFQNLSLDVAGTPIIYANSKGLVLSDEGKKYATMSAGIKWFNIQTSVLSSQRRNWSMTDDEKKAFAGGECNGEIIGGWDGITGDDMRELGFEITPDGFIKTSAAYPGYGMRVGMGLEYEYDYGTRSISDGVLAFIFVGRRTLAEGVKDVEKR